MAGTTSSIMSNLLSSLNLLSKFMPTFILFDASFSSSITQEDVTAAEVNSIQERLMEDLRRLSMMLQRIQAVLHDAEEREIHDKAIQLWLSELRDVAYDAEDVLDQYDCQVIKTQLKGMTEVAEAGLSLKRKRVDDNEYDDDIYGYQYLNNFFGLAADIGVHRVDWDSDGCSSDKDYDDIVGYTSRNSRWRRILGKDSTLKLARLFGVWV
ncbi:inactive disease susceptibility protein LOV1-like isoform X3 [Dendrobium catenatum]|uniref:inactive disease susceptibility protein LOV1-like isoform X3 n=1 Tax=Dendrobium catenatum TaxID=906689 RepID=UPI00109F4A43|nr:inactive disease susceptibility protein LOV1-like isoform X3 [Dendrobium catenatum]